MRIKIVLAKEDSKHLPKGKRDRQYPNQKMNMFGNKR